MEYVIVISLIFQVLQNDAQSVASGERAEEARDKKLSIKRPYQKEKTRVDKLRRDLNKLIKSREREKKNAGSKKKAGPKPKLESKKKGK